MENYQMVLCIVGPLAFIVFIAILLKCCRRNKKRDTIEPIQNNYSDPQSDTPTRSEEYKSTVVPDVEVTFAKETNNDNLRKLRPKRNNKIEVGELNDNESKDVKKVLKVKPTCDNGYRIVFTPKSLYGDHILPEDEFNQENAIKLSEKRYQPRWLSENTVFEDPNTFYECHIVGKSLIKSRENDQDIVFLVSARKVKTIHCYRSNSSRKWSDSEDCGENWAIFKKTKCHYERRCLEYDDVEFCKET